MNHESAPETLQDTSLLSSSSLEPGSKERSVLRDCGKCGRVISDPSHRISFKKRKKYLSGILDPLDAPICLNCFKALRAKKVKVASDSSLRGRVEIAIQDMTAGKMHQSHESISQELRQRIHEIKGRSETLIRQLANLNSAYTLMSSQVATLDKLRADIVGREYHQRRKDANYAISDEDLRLLVFSKDNWTCKTFNGNPKCRGKKSLTIDHIVPVIEGGTEDIENLQTLCHSCNSKKGATLSTPSQGGLD